MSSEARYRAVQSFKLIDDDEWGGLHLPRLRVLWAEDRLPEASEREVVDERVRLAAELPAAIDHNAVSAEPAYRIEERRRGLGGRMLKPVLGEWRVIEEIEVPLNPSASQ